MHGGPRPGLHGTAPPGFPPLPNQSARSVAVSAGAGLAATLVESSRSGGVLAVTAVQEEPEKPKRGRPRGYGCDGSAALVSMHKRGRGRPSGSGSKQRLSPFDGECIVGSVGIGFTPHVITIAVGEDISEKIMSFSRQGPRTVCILSANGAVSTVTLHQPGTPGVLVTYEGLFEILRLSGLYIPNENGGSHSLSTGLSICLSSPYGRVIGGQCGGLLTAAKPVQVIVGSFICARSSAKNKRITGQGSGDSSEHQIGDKQRAQCSKPPNQNITRKSTGGIPGSRQLDTSIARVDIDLTQR